MQDPACNRGPAYISTNESDPLSVCGALLLSEVLRYLARASPPPSLIDAISVVAS